MAVPMGLLFYCLKKYIDFVKRIMKQFLSVIIKEMKNKNPVIDLLLFFLKALILVAILINFVFIPCVVNGSSMVPTYREGEYGYSFILTKKLGINRFDTAVIRIDSGQDDKLLVKRVIGLPGETIEYKDNRLYVNGVYTEEPFLSQVTTTDLKVTLQENEYYCLGDNRNVSRDSRFYGPFDSDQIVSTHLLVLYPFQYFGFNR